MSNSDETPYRLVIAKDKDGKILQTTFCSSAQAARDVEQASIRHGQFWWADHETIPVPKPLTMSELAYMIAA